MIVVCSSCGAKFRIADEKMGPRGARIRCRKCQNVFEVRRPASGNEASQAAPPPPPPSAFELDLDESSGVRAGKPAATSFETPDPFAAAADPFAVPAAGDPRAAAATAVDGPAAAPEADPFVQPPAVAPPDPFMPPGLSPGDGSPPADDPFANLGPPFDGAAQLPAPLSDLALPPDLPAGSATPVPPAVPPPLPKREPAVAADKQKPIPADLPGPPAAVANGPIAGPSGDKPGAAEERSASARIRRRGQLRALLVNSLSVAALLAVAVGLFMFWRGEGRGPRGLQGGRLLGSAGEGVAAPQVATGFYQTLDGRLLLFVRGRIQVEQPPTLGAVRVRAEVVQGEKVVATAECTAGAVPNPEELANIAGPGDAERLRVLLAQRAPKQVRAGELLPFLAVFTDYPSDLETATIRVTPEAGQHPAPQ